MTFDALGGSRRCSLLFLVRYRFAPFAERLLQLVDLGQRAIVICLLVCLYGERERW